MKKLVVVLAALVFVMALSVEAMASTFWFRQAQKVMSGIFAPYPAQIEAIDRWLPRTGTADELATWSAWKLAHGL